MTKLDLEINHDTWMEICNISSSAFAPIEGFMDEKNYRSVVDEMHLCNGEAWTLPITLDIPENKKEQTKKSSSLNLFFQGNLVAQMEVEDVFQIQSEDTAKIFKVSKKEHPGVAKELSRSQTRAGGKITLLSSLDDPFSSFPSTPAETKKFFAEHNWKKVTGFQTRNPPHRAHEYLQRIALEVSDGIFIQPLIGWKKADDFSPKAVLQAYKTLISQCYPKNRALLGILQTPMRYAGPREAVFHAIIRRNYGCTHFIVGRDHAGVGGYYGKYEAQQLCQQFTNLGIEVLSLCGPFYCKKCQMVVTEKTCCSEDQQAASISGTQVRELLLKGEHPPHEFMRPEIAEVLIELGKKGELFCGK